MLPDRLNRTLALSAIAFALAEDEQLERTVEITQNALDSDLSVPDDLDRALAFSAIAFVFVEAGDRDRALDLVNKALVLVEY